MKKRIFACMAAAMLVSVSSVSVNAESTMIFDSDNKSLQMDGIVAVADYQGAAAALLELTYTNKTSEGKSPMYEYFPTIYQDGVSLSSTVPSDPNYATLCNNSLTQVKDGASVSYAVAYKLINLESDLEIEIKDAIAGGNVQTFTIPTNSYNDALEAGTADSNVQNSENVITDLPHVESDKGTYDLIGYDFYNYNGKDFIIVFNHYENTTSESCYPNVQYITKLFQDGVQIEIGVTDYGINTENGKKYKPASTALKPGANLDYLFAYELESTSDITLEVHKYADSEILGECIIPYGGTVTPDEEPDYKALYEELLPKYEQLLKDYEALTAETE